LAKMENLQYLSMYTLWSEINVMWLLRIHQRIIKVLSSGIYMVGKCIFSVLWVWIWWFWSTKK